jgi:hypothetical protein
MQVLEERLPEGQSRAENRLAPGEDGQRFAVRGNGYGPQIKKMGGYFSFRSISNSLRESKELMVLTALFCLPFSAQTS